MKINSVDPIGVQTKRNSNNRKNHTIPTETVSQTVSFKGEQGQVAGSALGMLAGVAASFVVGPLAALAVAGVGLVAGGVAGDKIEDKSKDKGKGNN